MRWLVRGDVDGFFGLALDNLVQLLLIDALCRGVLGFPNELIYGRVLPGVAVSLVVGNLFYARQALRLAKRSPPSHGQPAGSSRRDSACPPRAACTRMSSRTGRWARSTARGTR